MRGERETERARARARERGERTATPGERRPHSMFRAVWRGMLGMRVPKRSMAALKNPIGIFLSF
jgi:hypothetical protein